MVNATSSPKPTLTLTLTLTLALRLPLTRSTQRLLLGDSHPECAQTLHDIGTALQAMLTHAPQLLFRNRPEWGTAARAVRSGPEP